VITSVSIKVFGCVAIWLHRVLLLKKSVSHWIFNPPKNCQNFGMCNLNEIMYSSLR